MIDDIVDKDTREYLDQRAKDEKWYAEHCIDCEKECADELGENSRTICDDCWAKEND